MNCYDAAAQLGLLLTEKTGSCSGILTLQDVKEPEQLKLFGCVLVHGKHNTVIIKGVDETVIVAERRKVFGRWSCKPALVYRFAELGEE